MAANIKAPKMTNPALARGKLLVEFEPQSAGKVVCVREFVEGQFYGIQYQLTQDARNQWTRLVEQGYKRIR